MKCIRWLCASQCEISLLRRQQPSRGASRLRDVVNQSAINADSDKLLVTSGWLGGNSRKPASCAQR